MGLGGAAVLTRFLKSVLYEVTATDPVTFGAMALLLSAVALAACLVPARRAARVDPAVALRSE
jgi:ABC-type lipoprotein release transport system permease subunit